MQIFIALALMLLVMVPVSSHACTCPEKGYENAEEIYRSANIVARFKVIHISQGWDTTGPLARMQALEVYKGEDIPNELAVYYNNVPDACGHELEEGREYMFGLYDIRDKTTSFTDVTQNYGFRLMVSCYQNQIQYYMDNLYQEDKK